MKTRAVVNVLIRSEFRQTQTNPLKSVRFFQSARRTAQQTLVSILDRPAWKKTDVQLRTGINIQQVSAIISRLIANFRAELESRT